MSVVINIIDRLRHEAEAALENKLCEQSGATQCIVTYNEDDALAVALRAVGVRSGMQVVCPALGDPVLLCAVQRVGATAVFCDINPEMWTLDATELEQMLLCRKNTGKALPHAVIASDMLGLPCDYPKLKEICMSYKIMLIADIRHSLSAKINEQRCTIYSDASVALISSAPEISVMFCDTASPEIYNNSEGISQLSIIDISLATHKLSRLEPELAARREVAKIYKKYLPKTVRLQYFPEGFLHSYSGFGVVFESEQACVRVRESLCIAGLLGFEAPPMLLHRLVGRMSALSRMPCAERLSGRLLLLPMHAWLNKKTISQIAGAVTSQNIVT